MVVDSLDVIARLADHQQNLAIPLPRTASVVVCLPPPPIERALSIDAPMQARRRALCESLAEAVGGGDGPAPVAWLHGAGAIARALEAWKGDGVERIFVVGAREQPGWARALMARWSGGLRIEHAIDHEIAVVRDGFLTREGVTRCEAEPSTGASFAVGGEGVLGCWLGFVPPAARLAAQDVLRDAWVQHWSARGEEAAVKAALVGIDPALEEALHRPTEPARWGRAATVAITGIDGSGKSTQVATLLESLAQRRFSVRAIKLYRQGLFLELANELSGRTRRGASLGMFRVSRVVKLVDSLRVLRDEVLPALASDDVVVFDRYLETHEAAGAQLTWDLSNHPALAVFPRVDVQVLMRLDAETSMVRLGRRGGVRSADEHPTGQRIYAREFDRIAARDGFVVLDARDDRDENARSIAREVDAQIARDRSHAYPSAPSFAPRPRVRTGGDGLSLGGPVEDGAPGDDACALADFVRALRPDASEAFSEGFWFEAYAAQVLLDLRSADARGAEVAWWPAALVRVPEFSDLTELLELERMTLARAPVRRVLLDTEGFVQRLRSFVGDRAERLGFVYRQAFEAHAHERGWSIVSSGGPTWS